jgi:arylsulfatase A-like enzyme
LLIGTLLWPVAVRGADRPNVLFLFADDLRRDATGVFGNPVVKTPNLDALAEEGMRFSRAYCLGSDGGAVCVPSRAMVNSGRTLFRINSQLKDIPTLGQTLQQAGYATFGTGKWHNGEESFVRSFQQGRNVFFGGMSDHTKVPLKDLADGQLSEKRIGEKFSSTLFADAAIEFLDSCGPDQPFYLYVAFTTPHDPRQAPGNWLTRYSPDQVPLPDNFLPQHPFFNGWMTGRDETLAPWPRTRTIIRHQLAEYYGMISHMDRQIGRILKALRKSGQADNTLILFSADHGLALGSHGLLGKQSVYEHSMGTPLIVHGLDVPAGTSSDAFVYLYDLFPTICDCVGVAPPPGVEGHSLAPLWRGKQRSVRDVVFLTYEDLMRSVRDDRWKLIRYPHINRTQLFDLQEDPHEMHDLASDHRHARRVADMLALLEEQQHLYGDTLSLTSAEPQSPVIDLTGRERTPDSAQPEWIVRKYFQLEGWKWQDE